MSQVHLSYSNNNNEYNFTVEIRKASFLLLGIPTEFNRLPMNYSGRKLEKVSYKVVDRHPELNLGSSIKRVICVRLLVVAALLCIRAVTAYFHPDLFMQSRVLSAQINSFIFYPASEFIQIRGVLLGAVLAGYCYALITGRYYKPMALIAMVVASAFLWSDMELFMISSVTEITTVSFALLAMRVIAVWLLVLNYLDIHR